MPSVISGAKTLHGVLRINRFGLMEPDPLIVRAELKLLKRCEEIVVLADSRKLRQRSAMIVVDLTTHLDLITDSGATEEELTPFRDAQIRVIQVGAGDATDSVAQVVGS